MECLTKVGQLFFYHLKHKKTCKTISTGLFPLRKTEILSTLSILSCTCKNLVVQDVNNNNNKMSGYGNIEVLFSSRNEGCFPWKLHHFHYPGNSCSLQPLQLKYFSFQDQDTTTILISYAAKSYLQSCDTLA